MQFIRANATARLAGGCATEPLAHARKQMNALYDCAIRNLGYVSWCNVEGDIVAYNEIYRTAVFIVEMDRTKPHIPTIKEDAICLLLSPTLSECLNIRINVSAVSGKMLHNTYRDSVNATPVANNQGGAHKSNVTMGPYPSVAVSVGK